jgi:hypothetical protein
MIKGYAFRFGPSHALQTLRYKKGTAKFSLATAGGYLRDNLTVNGFRSSNPL